MVFSLRYSPLSHSAQVYHATWWMAKYGGLTPKRHIAWSNARTVRLLDLGSLIKETRDLLSQHACQSTKKYVSKKTGRKGFSGSRFLKQTQILDLGVGNVFLFSLVISWIPIPWSLHPKYLSKVISLANTRKHDAQDISSSLCTPNRQVLRSLLQQQGVSCGGGC